MWIKWEGIGVFKGMWLLDHKMSGVFKGMWDVFNPESTNSPLSINLFNH